MAYKELKRQSEGREEVGEIKGRGRNRILMSGPWDLDIMLDGLG